MNNDVAAQTIWDYLVLDVTLQPAECLLVLGSSDIRVAKYAAELYHKNLAPLVVVTGGYGKITKNIFHETEAETFAKILIKNGVPEKSILLEKEATNTGHNLINSIQLLKDRGLEPKSYIVVTKPYMERRAYAAFKKRFPDFEIIMASPPIDWKNYPNEIIKRDEVINIMIGDLDRILKYPELGFQISQDVPANVMAAYGQLINAGFTKYLLKD